MANNMIACRKSFTDTLLELARQDKDIGRLQQTPEDLLLWGILQKNYLHSL